MMSVMVRNVVKLSNDEEKTSRKRKRINDAYNSLPTAIRQPNEQSSTNSHTVKEMTQLKPEQRLATYIFSAEGQINDKSETIKAKFKCTYQNCKKILQGNVAFISHLWAHIVQVGQRQQQKNIQSITTCKQCLLSFESPYKMQVHYTKCHSRISEAIINAGCQICEKEVPNLLEHLTLHPPKVASYACQIKFCKYRSTQRTVLFNHYIQRHANCMYLSCPFCTYTKLLSRSQLRTKAIITCKSFVDHMAEHERVLTTYRCSNCAYSFLSHDDMERHCASDHKRNVNSKWTIKQLPTDAFRQQKISSIHTKGTANCDACIVNGSSVVARCAKCKIAAYEKFILKLKEKNSVCYIATDGWYLNKYESGFAMRDGNLVTSPRLKVRNSLALTKTKSDHSKQEYTQEDIFEARIFAVIHPAPAPASSIQPSLPQMTTVRKVFEVIREIRDEFADIDDLKLLARKKFLVRAQFDDIHRSFRQFDEHFRSK